MMLLMKGTLQYSYIAISMFVVMVSLHKYIDISNSLRIKQIVSNVEFELFPTE